MGSPATAGRESAGYGGMFARMAPEFRSGHVVDVDGRTDGQVFGMRSAAVTMWGGSARVTVRADPVASEPWFVRRDDYPGICAALAFDRPLNLAAGETMTRSYRITVGDAAA